MREKILEYIANRFRITHPRCYVGIMGSGPNFVIGEQSSNPSPCVNINPSHYYHPRLAMFK